MTKTFTFTSETNGCEYKLTLNLQGQLVSIKTRLTNGTSFTQQTAGEPVEVADTCFRLGENWRYVPTCDTSLRECMKHMLEVFPPVPLQLVG